MASVFGLLVLPAGLFCIAAWGRPYRCQSTLHPKSNAALTSFSVAMSPLLILPEQDPFRDESEEDF